MARLTFEDKSYIEVRMSKEPDKVIMVISSRDAESSNKKIINSVEITTKEFRELIADIK